MVTFGSLIGLGLTILIWYRWHTRRRRGEILLSVGRICATLTRRGLPLAQGLAGLSKDAPAKQRRVIERIARSLEAGLTLSQALADEHPIFPPTYVGLIRAGERSGTLDRVLSRMEEVERFHHTTYADLRMKLLYPMLLGAFVLLGIGLWAFKMEPKFVEIARDFGGVSIPQFALLGNRRVDLMVIAVVITIVPFVALTLCSIVDWMDPEERWGERLRLLLPVVGRGERQLAYAHFASTLAAILESGASTREAMDLASNLDLVGRLHDGLLRAREAHREGRSLAEAFAKLWRAPAVLTRAVQSAETGGAIVSNLDRASDILLAGARRQLEWVSEAIIPATIPLVGFLVFAQGARVIAFLSGLMDSVR